MSRRKPRHPFVLAVWAVLALAVFGGLIALGNWQIERRAWKLDLIQRIDDRVHRPAVPAPSPDQWPQLSRAADEYRRVRVSGILLHDHETLVQAATELGSGYWVLTPLQTPDGAIILINLGFVPATDTRKAETTAPDTSPVTVTGLLRLTEPEGGFLRQNDPAQNRWYSRDVQHIAAARGLSSVAPYFLDAETPPMPESGPAGSPQTLTPTPGLTVLAFNNNHMVYAITWYSLALMVLLAAGYVIREEQRLRQAENRHTLGEEEKPNSV